MNGGFAIRIASGNLKGKKISFTSFDEKTRPTKDKIKQALFNILQFDLENSVFLDLFGGTGQIGLEALSRNVRKVFIVEVDKKNIKLIKHNAKDINVSELYVVHGDAVKFLKNTEEVFNIAFLDPPYGSEILNSSLILMSKKMSKNGIIITETKFNEVILEDFDRFFLQKKYKYGNIALNCYFSKINGGI